MPAEAGPAVWTAYCEECDWESTDYHYLRASEQAAEQHNDAFHKDDLSKGK